MILVYIFVLVLKGICLSGKSIFYMRIKYTHINLTIRMNFDFDRRFLV